MHIAKIGEKREKTFNFSPFCGIMNYIKKKTNLIQMLDFTVFVHISKCIKIVQVKRRIPVLFFVLPVKVPDLLRQRMFLFRGRSL